MSTMSEGRPTRLNIRVSEHEKDVITRAAGTLNTTVSRFVRQMAYAQAQAVLAEQVRFRLSEAKWREFCQALDAPPKDIPALRRLLTEPAVFDA